MTPDEMAQIAQLLKAATLPAVTPEEFVRLYFDTGRKVMDRLTDPADRLEFAQTCADILRVPRANMFLILTRRAKYAGER